MPDSGSDNPEAGPKGESKSPVASRFTTEIDTRWGDILLLICFFVAGLVDSAAFNMYGCFVSMQTGQFICLNRYLKTQTHMLQETQSLLVSASVINPKTYLEKHGLAVFSLLFASPLELSSSQASTDFSDLRSDGFLSLHS
jgi:hypothetical protein